MLEAARVVGRRIEVIILSPGGNPSVARIVENRNSRPDPYSTERSASGVNRAFRVKIRILLIAAVALGNMSDRKSVV